MSVNAGVPDGLRSVHRARRPGDVHSAAVDHVDGAVEVVARSPGRVEREVYPVAEAVVVEVKIVACAD